MSARIWSREWFSTTNTRTLVIAGVPPCGFPEAVLELGVGPDRADGLVVGVAELLEPLWPLASFAWPPQPVSTSAAAARAAARPVRRAFAMRPPFVADIMPGAR